MSGPVLFFDGVCNLCNGAVQFIIRHDKAGRIRFASLQSAVGQEAAAAVRKQHGMVPDSLIFLEQGQYFVLSDAALRVAAYLDGGWRLLRRLRAIPRPVRDAVYRFVARNRYRWFGKRESCMMPAPGLMSRFLNG